MGARGAENRVGKCLAKDGFSSRQGQMPQLGQGAEVSRSASMAARFRMLRKGDVRGLSPKAWVVKRYHETLTSSISVCKLRMAIC